jgi:hypothetical protein
MFVLGTAGFLQSCLPSLFDLGRKELSSYTYFLYQELNSVFRYSLDGDLT